MPVETNQRSFQKIIVKEKPPVKVPDLWLSVYIVGPPSEVSLFPEWLVQHNCTLAPTIEEADLVIFAGGEDVNPALYEETPHNLTHFSQHLDELYIQAYKECLAEGAPMLGVCRGAQFLWVMNGGKLYQDVDGHYGEHSIWDCVEKQIVKVSSVHHQLCRETPGMTEPKIIAYTTGRSTTRYLNKTDKETGAIKDIEAYFIPETCCLGVQSHPEYREHKENGDWVVSLITRYIVHNPDLGYDYTKVLRIREPKNALKKEAS